MATTSTKPQLPKLRTPVSATYPSEVRSPMVSGRNTPTLIKLEEGALKTPITPPSAYMDFLKSHSPVSGLFSPIPTSAHFKFGEKALTPSVTSAPLVRPSSIPSTASSSASFTSTSTAPSVTSSASSASTSGSNTPADNEPPKSAPPTKVDTNPTSPKFTRPHSARMPRRLLIPQSPFSPSRASPLSAASRRSLQSPFSPYSAVISPQENDDDDKKSTPGHVSVRQVVTRTVTYTRTPLDPAPKGKRRRTE